MKILEGLVKWFWSLDRGSDIARYKMKVLNSVDDIRNRLRKVEVKLEKLDPTKKPNRYQMDLADLALAIGTFDAKFHDRMTKLEARMDGYCGAIQTLKERVDAWEGEWNEHRKIHRRIKVEPNQ